MSTCKNCKCKDCQRTRDDHTQHMRDKLKNKAHKVALDHYKRLHGIVEFPYDPDESSYLRVKTITIEYDWLTSTGMNTEPKKKSFKLKGTDTGGPMEWSDEKKKK